MIKTVQIPQTEQFDLYSEQTDTNYQIWVANPVSSLTPSNQSADTNNTKRPEAVLYVLDANLYFGTAVEMTRVMSQLYNELPYLLVVGIAYDTGDTMVQSQLRARDYTPTTDSQFAAISRQFIENKNSNLEEINLGGGHEFLSFLTTNVIPLINERYAVGELRSVLFGSSLGGLFTISVVLDSPLLFDAYISVSPSLWWDNSVMLQKEIKLSSKLKDLSADLFLAVGGEEERQDIPMLAQYKMISNMTLFADRLSNRNYESLNLKHYIAEGETHTSIVPIGLIRGLRFAFRNRSKNI